MNEVLANSHPVLNDNEDKNGTCEHVIMIAFDPGNTVIIRTKRKRYSPFRHAVHFN